MHILVILLLAASAVEASEPEIADVAYRERLVQALIDLGAAPMQQESEFLRDHVMREAVDIAGRIAAFDAFLADHPFTEHHAANLEAHIVYGTAERERMARFAGAFAAAAVRCYWENVSLSPEAPLPALLLLERAYTAGDDKIIKAMAEGMDDALRSHPVKLATIFADANLPPGAHADAMQCCITLGVFKGDRDIERWLDVPKSAAAFVNATGVWLFDGNMLSDGHLRSLESIFKTAPPQIHGVSVLFVPAAVPFSAASAPLRLPGLALDIPPAPVDLLRDLSELPPYIPQPPIPEFTSLALEQVMQAIVATCLPKRPDLAQRAAAVMRLAVVAPDSPLGQIAPPEALFGTPELFLAYLGVLWLANTEALLEPALMLAEQGVVEPLYAILLVADLFSEQENTTMLFRTTPAGMLTGSETALRRVFISPAENYVNGIAFAGRLWQYDMSEFALLP